MKHRFNGAVQPTHAPRVSRLFIVYRDSVRLSVIINVGQVRPRPDSLRTALRTSFLLRITANSVTDG